MGLICEYFIAGDESLAGATASWQGGPSKPPASKGGLFRKKAADPASPLPTFDFGGIEPVVMLATLEEELTGASADDVLEINADAEVASGNGVMVFRVRTELLDALAEASQARLREVAAPWSQTEEFFDSADPEVLADGLGQLASLARQAKTTGESMYCWMSN